MNYKYLAISLLCFAGGLYAIWKSFAMADVIRWPLFLPGCLLVFWGALYGKNVANKK